MVPESHIGRRGGWVIIYPHLKTMAILKIVQTFILLTVSKSCCSNNPAKYFCFVITVHRKLYPVSRIIAVPPPPIIVSYAGRKTEKISATKNLLKRDLGFTFPFSFWICFLGFVLFVFFFISSHCEYAYKFVFVKLRNFSRGGLQILILRIPNCRSQEVTWSVIINDHYFYNTNSVEIIFRSWPLPIPLYSIHAPEGGGGEGGTAIYGL